MAKKFVCDKHGPYEAHLRSCPLCSPPVPGRLEAAPGPDEDGVPTQLWENDQLADYEDMEITGPRLNLAGLGEDFEETKLPSEPGTEEDWDKLEVEETVVVDRPVETDLLGWLIIKEGSGRGKIFEIKDGSTIGRKQGTVIINDPKMSRLHAKIRIKAGRFEIGDMLSENGTFVNGQPVEMATPLQENDEIKVGDTVLVLKTLS